MANSSFYKKIHRRRKYGALCFVSRTLYHFLRKLEVYLEIYFSKSPFLYNPLPFYLAKQQIRCYYKYLLKGKGVLCVNGQTLRVQMLGGFSIRLGDREINDSDNRSKKVWLLLAYMIYRRQRSIPQDSFFELLWGSGKDNNANPLNALKTMFHRARATLDQLEPAIGHRLIIRQEGSYALNTNEPLVCDIDEFENLCRSAAASQDRQKRLELYLQALPLYGGDFLPRMSAESWVVPVSAYFHNLYNSAVHETLALLEEAGRLSEAADIVRRATELSPYEEELYQALMRLLLALDRQQEVVEIYQTMSELLFETFGVMPSDESTVLYRKALSSTNQLTISMDLVRGQLMEDSDAPGAMICDYDFFRFLCQSAARSMARTGDVLHIALVSVSGKNGELSRRSLDICMDNLGDMLRSRLRRGDAVSRCSLSQYIVLLPMANYENSCRVMERIIWAFCRQYPHSPAELHATIQPLEGT